MSKININVFLYPQETNDLPLLLFSTSEWSYLSFRMSCFSEKQQRHRDKKEWDHSTPPEQETATYWFCQWGSEPALPSISDSSLSHSLCASYHCSVSFSQMQNRGWGMYHSSHNKTGMLLHRPLAALFPIGLYVGCFRECLSSAPDILKLLIIWLKTLMASVI